MFADEMAKQGRIEEAERRYLEAIELGKRRSRINPSDDRWRRALERLVRAEQDMGRTAKADEFQRFFAQEKATPAEAQRPSREGASSRSR